MDRDLMISKHHGKNRGNVILRTVMEGPSREQFDGVDGTSEVEVPIE